MTWVQSLADELVITAANPNVWASVGIALLFGAGCLAIGTFVARSVGLLEGRAPAGEALAVGLAAGLMVLAAWWAAIWSGGRSSFTPIAVGFAIAVGSAFARRVPSSASHDEVDVAAEPASPPRRSFALTVLAGAAFVAAMALLYGSTMAPSPRDGLQPVERTDVAFYAVLGKGLADTGTEMNTFTSGFSDLPGGTAQTWYHWGELWLAAAVIAIFGSAPLAARYLVVLPVLLLAAGALTGTLVRCLGGSRSRPAFLFGFLVCLILTPIPLIAGPFFSGWAAGLVFGISVFGLAAVAVLFALYLGAVLGTCGPTWTLATFAGCAIALILPSHIVIALLGLVGIGGVWTIRIGRSLLATGHLPAVPTIWRRTAVATTIALGATVAWGTFTGHGLGGGGSLTTVSAFNASWRDTIAIVALGAGLLLTIPLAWLLDRRDAPAVADIYLGTIGILIVGAFIWGWRLASFNMFYFFFAGIAVVATPMAAVAAWRAWAWMRATRHPRLVVVLGVVCLVQLELSLVVDVTRLQGHSPDYRPIPVSVLHAIEQLPPDAKLAYACQSFEEISFVNSKLLGIDAHTGHRIVPMCFEADVNGPLLGAPPSTVIADAGFAAAPQATLYPDAAAKPSMAAVAAFLKEHGIDYVYADAGHPNSLVDDAVPIATSGGAELLMVP
jgi:hypothetical protein